MHERVEPDAGAAHRVEHLACDTRSGTGDDRPELGPLDQAHRCRPAPAIAFTSTFSTIWSIVESTDDGVEVELRQQQVEQRRPPCWDPACTSSLLRSTAVEEPVDVDPFEDEVQVDPGRGPCRCRRDRRSPGRRDPRPAPGGRLGRRSPGCRPCRRSPGCRSAGRPRRRRSASTTTGATSLATACRIALASSRSDAEQSLRGAERRAPRRRCHEPWVPAKRLERLVHARRRAPPARRSRSGSRPTPTSSRSPTPNPVTFISEPRRGPNGKLCLDDRTADVADTPRIPGSDVATKSTELDLRDRTAGMSRRVGRRPITDASASVMCNAGS